MNNHPLEKILKALENGVPENKIEIDDEKVRDFINQQYQPSEFIKRDKKDPS